MGWRPLTCGSCQSEEFYTPLCAHTDLLLATATFLTLANRLFTAAQVSKLHSVSPSILSSIQTGENIFPREKTCPCG